MVFFAMSCFEHGLWVRVQSWKSSFAPTFSDNMTGRLASIASRHAMPKGSWMDGMMKSVALLKCAASSLSCTKPGNSNDFWTPRVFAKFSRLSLRWPSPRMINRQFGICFRMSVDAYMRYSIPFWNVRRDAHSMVGISFLVSGVFGSWDV